MFQKLLPFKSEMDGEHAVGPHDKQLSNHFRQVQFQHALHSRSIFGMVSVYNGLAQNVVDLQTVASFQIKLIKIVRFKCQLGDEYWHKSFNGRCIYCE